MYLVIVKLSPDFNHFSKKFFEKVIFESVRYYEIFLQGGRLGIVVYALAGSMTVRSAFRILAREQKKISAFMANKALGSHSFAVIWTDVCYNWTATLGCWADVNNKSARI